ncbi:MAG: leucine-rich repeat domain-containing protein [Ancrocorticia sp.]
MMRGVAGLLAFGLLFPGGAAVAAPETQGDDVVVTETVDTAPVEPAALSQPSPKSSPSPTPKPSPSPVGEVVEFEDAGLKACVADALGRDPAADITKQDLAALDDYLSCYSRGIVDITPLQYATGIWYVELGANKIVDASALAGLTNLTWLGLDVNQLTDLTPLKGLSGLQGLKLSDNQIADVSPLEVLTGLKHLALDRNQIIDASPLANLANIKYLGLTDQHVTLRDAVSGVRFVLPEVRAADGSLVSVFPDTGPASGSGEYVTWELPDGGEGKLSWNGSFTVGTMESPADFTGTMTQKVLPPGPGPGDEVVEFKDANLKACVATGLQREPDLAITKVDLESFTYLACEYEKIVDISPLQYATNLETLWLGSNEIVDISPLAGLTKLHWLDLGISGEDDLIPDKRGNKIVDVSPLAGLTNLESLDLTDNRITDLSPLRGLNGLRVLELADNQISDLSPLAVLTGLTYLDLIGNEIVDVSSLVELTSLRILKLDDNRISDVSALARLVKLESLQLDNNSIGDLKLAGLTSLGSLSVRENQIASVSQLADLTALYHLDLSGNRVVDVSPLAGLTELYWVELRDNRVVDASPLAGLPNLQWLYLSGNQIVDASPFVDISEMYAWDLSNQKIHLADVTSGEKFTLPAVRFYDNSTPPLSIASGKGSIEEGTVTWNQPKGGEGKLAWSKEFQKPGKSVVFEFSGTLTQKVLPAGPVVEQPVASATPTISGKAKVGETLTAKPGKWTSGATFTYQWLADGKAIKGATKATLVLKADQVGERISVKVTGSKAGYKSVSKTSAKTGAVAKGTLTSAVPTIGGKAKVGEKLTATPGKWTSGTKFAYQWYASGKKIKGATGSTFVVTTAQLGERITVKVTGSKAGYTTVSKTSVKTAVVAKGTLSTATPTISGKAKVGEKLTAAPGKWTSGTKFTYQWLADGKAIKNATNSSYTVKAAAAGKSISVKVTGTKSGYKSATKTSKATGQVTPRS